MVLLLPLAGWLFSSHSWVEIRGVSLQSPKTRWIHRNYLIWLLLFYFLTANCLPEPCWYQQSQVNSYLKVRITQVLWSSSHENIPAMFLIYSPQTKLHQPCTDAELRHVEMDSRYLWEIDLHCMNRVLCEVYVALELCHIVCVLIAAHVRLHLLTSTPPVNLKSKVLLKH